MGDDVQNVLPKLGDKRLSLAGKQSHRTRKITSIVNEKLRRKTGVLNKSLDKDSKSYGYKMWQKSIPLKDQMLQMRSTKRCLQKRRESMLFEDSEENQYGVYNGMSLHDLRHEIDQVIQDSHPRARRLRKVERLLQNGKTDGRILDYSQARESLEHIIKRPQFPPKKETNLSIRIRPSSANVSPELKQSSSQLHLPPINISRENTMESVHKPYDRFKSRSLPAIFGAGTRSRTFAFEPKFEVKTFSRT